MLAFEPHLHLPVGLRDQLAQLANILTICNHPFVLIKLIGEGFFKLLQAMLLRSLIKSPEKLGVLLFDLL
jgi:hypothetical protein